MRLKEIALLAHDKIGIILSGVKRTQIDVKKNSFKGHLILE
jgi:hypothetical protein